MPDKVITPGFWYVERKQSLHHHINSYDIVEVVTGEVAKGRNTLIKKPELRVFEIGKLRSRTLSEFRFIAPVPVLETTDVQ